MKYKVIALDFDGTILRSDGTVSERTKKAINDYKEKGGNVFLCTGRMFNSIRVEADKVGLSGDVYCYQGAAMYDSKTGTRKLHTPISNKYLLDICKYFEERDIYFQTYLDDIVFCKKFTDAGDYYYKNFSKGARVATSVPLSEYLAKRPESRPTKILAIISPEEILGHIDAINEKFGSSVQAMCSNPDFLEIVSNRAGKGNAILNYCKQCGVSVEESVAFGDSINDISMIKTAGVGVAVENARDELKEVADYICPSNDNDGVAEVIEMIMGGSFDLMK